ncbi:hypothetical protein BGX38DRAFT_1274403 [Terfezia claveryi]|nr:hypothetical protein BGX38DRAFT_1274403 [Terfezia claveryi]
MALEAARGPPSVEIDKEMKIIEEKWKACREKDTGKGREGGGYRAEEMGRYILPVEVVPTASQTDPAAEKVKMIQVEVTTQIEMGIEVLEKMTEEEGGKR